MWCVGADVYTPTVSRLRGVKTWLGNESTPVEVTECNQVYRESLEQITYLQVKVIAARERTLVYVRHILPMKRTQTGDPDSHVCVRSTITAIVSLKLRIFVCVREPRDVCERTSAQHQSYARSFVTSFRHVPMARRRPRCFSALLARRHGS